MEMRSAIQIMAIERALRDIILPSVPLDNALAQEQGAIVLKLLGLMTQRLPQQFAYDVADLALMADMAQSLVDAAGAEGAELVEELPAIVSAARSAVAGAQTMPDEVEGLLLRIRVAIGRVAELEMSRNADIVARLRSVMLAATKVQLHRERAWLFDMGFEPDDGSVEPIERQLPLLSRISNEQAEV